MKKLIISFITTLSLMLVMPFLSKPVKASTEHTVTYRMIDHTGVLGNYTKIIAHNNIFIAEDNSNELLSFKASVVNGDVRTDLPADYTYTITSDLALDHYYIGSDKVKIAFFLDQDGKYISHYYHNQGDNVLENSPNIDHLIPNGHKFDGWHKIDDNGTILRYSLQTSEINVPDQRPSKIDLIKKTNSTELSFTVPTYEWESEGVFGPYASTFTSDANNVFMFNYAPRLQVTIDKPLEAYDYFIIDVQNEVASSNQVDLIVPTLDFDRIEFSNINESIDVFFWKAGDLVKTFRMAQNFGYKMAFANHEQVDSWDSLPITSGSNESPGNIGEATITELPGGQYEITISYDARLYKVVIESLPSEFLVSSRIYYYSLNGRRYLMGFYKGQNNKYVDTPVFNNNVIQNSWIVWNLDQGDYKKSEINTIYAKMYASGDGFTGYNQLYTDIVIPHKIDDLLAIEVRYSYRHKFLNNSYSKYRDVHSQVLLKDQKQATPLPWWIDITRLYSTALINMNSPINIDMLSVKEIEDLTTDVDLNYKNDYIAYMNENGLENLTANDVFKPNSSIYKLFLGTKDEYFSVGVQAKDFAVLSYRYEYKGVVYSNPYSETISSTMPDPFNPLETLITSTENFFANVWSTFKKISWIAIGIVGILTFNPVFALVKNVSGRRAYRYRTILMITWIALLYIGWYLIVSTMGF